MILSEDRISHISHKIHDRIYLDELIEFIDEDEALKIIKQAFTDYLSLHDKIDDIVRAKISSLKKNVLEGMPEWEVLYRKYYEEELNKHHA